ncbi:MAG: MarR family transcriptional regulator [Chloroflexota bacterium]
MDPRGTAEGVVRALRKVNFQGSIFGQSIAIRLGLSESDIDALELLIDSGASTAGGLSELMGLTTGAVTRLIDRLEQAGYVRRTSDPGDRRRVVIEVVPERVATIESLLESFERATEKEVSRYSTDQLSLIADFLGRMAELTQAEAARLRTEPESDPSATGSAAEHSAPVGGLTSARLTFRANAQDLRLRSGRAGPELYRARFQGSTPQVRVRDGRVLIQYRGLPLFDWRKRSAALALNPTLPWSIDVVGGVNRVDADLREVDLRGFELTGGSERVQLDLGPAHADVPLRFVGGARTIRIERPAATPVRVVVMGGAQQLVLDGVERGRQGGMASVESAGWASAEGRYSLEVVGGSKSVTVSERR